MKAWVALTSLVLCGCSTQPAPTNAPSTPEETGSPVAATESPTARLPRVYVDSLVASRTDDVVENLTQMGLLVEIEEQQDCMPGVVVGQDPAPGSRVPSGSTVRLRVTEPPYSMWCIPTPPAQRGAKSLAAWARGEGPAPEFAEQVRLMQGNLVVLRLSAADAADRAKWILPGGYAERIPINIIDWLAEQDRLRLRDVPPSFCPERHVALPPDLVERLAFSRTLVNTGGTSCMELGALQVWVDPRQDRRIEAVNLVLGSP